ncbi:uncharacterized protein EAF01_002340 [Botrytis porri]|uniref:uncharacterized protein n=1 Tax=Botrytis porri TaxID=87229 RepID=UPI0018FF5814|nr:uncharacterized protein EAF01_002340 [Botrytis porri]KAF7910831.1 hypothetical protein EAF01_002340 [Botrytis porri]
MASPPCAKLIGVHTFLVNTAAQHHDQRSTIQHTHSCIPSHNLVTACEDSPDTGTPPKISIKSAF